MPVFFQLHYNITKLKTMTLIILCKLVACFSTRTRWNQDHLHSKILEDKIGQVKSDPKLRTTSSEAAATPGNVHI
jgi:hypothetical protein